MRLFDRRANRSATYPQPYYAADAGPWRRKIRATIEPPRCNA